MKIGYIISALILSTALLFGCNQKQGANESTASAGKQAQEKQPAPDITIPSLDGTKLTLSSLKGKVVLLNFWATWCPPCREEIPSMMKLNEKMAGKPFQMVAISIDEGGASAVKDFFKESGFKLPAYNDPEAKAGKLYGITGVPESFLIDKNGIIVKKVVGPMPWDSAEAVSFIENMMK